MTTAQSMTATAKPEHRSPVDPAVTVVNATTEDLWAELEYRNIHVGDHAEALQRRYQRYAVKFTVDAPQDEPADANLARVLANCGRRPRPIEYRAIRRYVELWRDARASGRASVAEQLHDRVESYANDAYKFADMNSTDVHAERYVSEEDCKRYAAMYRTLADELRKVAASL